MIRDDQVVSLVTAILLVGVKDGPETIEDAVALAQGIVYRFAPQQHSPCMNIDCNCPCHPDELL
jgi:hypothetical protein